MKTGVILLCSLFSLSSLARVPDYLSRLYRPLDNIKDISFTIKADHINELISSKASGKEIKNISINAFKYLTSSDIEILGIDNLDLSIKIKLRELFINKSKIVLGMNLKDWLADYKYVQTSNNWFYYEDESGVLDTMEIRIKFNNRKLYIIEKRPTGTLRAEYHYDKKDWSNGLLVLDKVIRKIYEGNQSVITESKIEYKKVDSFGWLPSKLHSKVTHNLNLGSTSKTNREFEEIFLFSDYFINQNKSENWFAAQK